MLLQTIDTDAATTATDCPIRRDLALLAAGLDTGFLRAGTTLATAVEMIDRMIGGLDGIVAALDERTAGAAVLDMRYVAERLSALPAHQRERAGRMAAVGVIAKTLNEHVLDMHKTLRVLSIYGMNIKIAASGEDQFVCFVEGMIGKLAAGEQHLAGFIARLKELTDAVASVRQADRLLAGESAKVVPEVPARLASDAVELAGHLAGVATLASAVAAIARSVQGKVAVVLGALQVGDSTRQRLEHVVSALQLVEARAARGDGAGHAAVIGHVDRLLAAQIDAALADFTRETTAMLTSLAELGPDTGRLLALIAEQDDGGTRAFLERLDRGITEVERVTTRLREAEGRSRTMVGIITETVGELSDRLTSVQRIRLDVQDIATNTRLLCRHHGVIGKAVSVIATDVDSYTVRLGGATVSVSDAIARLGGVEASLRGENRGDGDRDMGAMLAAALAVVRHACQRSEEAAVDGGDNARQLIDLLDHVGDELARELSVKTMMEAASQTLAYRTPELDMTDEADAALRVLLPEIAKLYTMASERGVHASFLLPGMAVAAVPSAVVDDDDDDGLF